MHSSFIRRVAAVLAAVASTVLFCAPPLTARADADTADAGVGVARISFIHGAVAVQRGDSTTPVGAVINAPILAADYVTTGGESRAELQFDATSMVRLDENVQVRLSHLDRGNRQLQLAQGTVDLRLLRGVDGYTDIDTPSVSIRPLSAGSYRVTVDAGGQTAVTVRSGRATVRLPQGDQALAAGNTLLASGTAAAPSVQSVAAIGPDDFDRFNDERDRRELRALADASFVDPGVPGVDDLDAYGRWVSDGTYGNVWVPTYVATGWAPYRDGRWVWEDGFGWTWLGYEPWGWAPYHYGRWYHSAAYGWAWYPPPPAVVYAPWRPALVAFIGFGSGGFSLGFGNIGWVPLAPFEPYHPWWGRGYNQTTVVNNINVTNNYYNVTKVYGNARYNGVTYVPQQRFTEGRFEHPSVMTATQLQSAHIVQGAVPVVPTQANLRFDDRPVPAALAAHPPALQRSFAGTAAVVQRIPFEQQRTAVATHVIAHSVPVQTNGTPGARSAADPWSRFGQNRAASAPVVDGAKPAAGRAAATTHGTDATVRSKVPSGDAWSRFDASGAASHPSTESKPSRSVTPNTARPSNASVPHASVSGASRSPGPSHRSAAVHATKAHHTVPPHPASRTHDGAPRN